MSFLEFDEPKETSSSFLLASNAKDLHQSTNERDAAEEDALMEAFRKDPKAALALAENYLQASQVPKQAMAKFTPVPGFVIETTMTEDWNGIGSAKNSTPFPKDSHVFINVCSSDQLPKPPRATEAEIQKAINAEEDATYQVPFQISSPREYQRAGQKGYLVVDACINSDPYKRAEKDFDFKLYIMELAMEWVEEKCRIKLSRNFELPGIRSKDALPERSVLLPKPSAIQEVEGSPVKPEKIKATSADDRQKSSTGRTDKEVGVFHVPTGGKTDIDLNTRLMPCPRGTLGIIVEVDLPNHNDASGVTLDVVLPDKLVLHSKSRGLEIDQGREYHAEVDMPNEPLDPNSIRAVFNKKRGILRVFTTKLRR
ncbi:hypothetical protein BGW38_006890 [Lunasporangiospora selenospora]|uniref:PIH1 N-terminal domain-containing protein n=1 Tax=Lunasporangiospora selenospora TaxID=979761 RepID=A0A9P6G0V5_9FUNG|nr:hypothetical protein BGW38_006890 [Lunasporangiospora selenospora]